MKKSILFILALGVMTSCLKEEFPVQEQVADPGFKVTATLDEVVTRTQMTSDYKVMWSEGDAISVFNKGNHHRFILEEGAGELTAEFGFDLVNGTVSGGIDTEISKQVYVGVYPYNANTTVSKDGENVVVNTFIPEAQVYSVNSFGQNASPMVGMNTYMPEFYFRNVGTMLILPLKGETVISKVTVESKYKAIAGATSVTLAGNDLVIDATAGEKKVTLECGEGVQLDPETATNFYVVMAPGTYKANELVIRFHDAYGNFYETTNASEKTYARSTPYKYNERTYEVNGVEELDLWVKAKAGASMTAERIIPSVTNLNVEAWVKNLVNHPNTKGLIEEAITYITLGQYELAYDVLGGIPGFVRDYEDFKAVGTYFQKVDYTGVGFIKSMLDDVDKINDIPSLLKFLNDFDNLYEASGIKNKLDESLGSIADNFDKYIDKFVEEMWKSEYEGPELDNTLTEEEAFANYKSTLKTQLENTIKAGEGFIKIWVLDVAQSEKQSLEAFLVKANALNEKFESLKTKAEVDKEIKALGTIDINVNLYITKIEYSVDPATWLTGAEKDYNDYLAALKNQIAGNEDLITAATAAAKATVRTAVKEIEDLSLVESLEKAVNEPDSITGKVLNYLFSQEEFLNMIKSTLREIVSGIEDASQDLIMSGNVSLKQQAIYTSKNTAILYARSEAVDAILKQLDATNEENLNGGAWGLFKRVMKWEATVQFFTQYGILEVYEAFEKLTEVIDSIITFNRTSIYYDIENFDDYQENVDWWVVTYSQEF